VFLMVSTRVHLRVLGVNPLKGSTALDSRMGTAYGIYPWVALMGKFDGETFLGRLWMFFLGGSGGGRGGDRDRQ
jgi:hypothetical protein